MKKSKLFQSALSLMLVGGMLTACGSSASSTAASTAASTGSNSTAASTASDSAAPAATKQYVIGIAEAQANDEVTTRRAYLEDFIAPTYNVKFIFSETLKDDAATKTFIENCIDSGADAIIDMKSASGQMGADCGHYMNDIPTVFVSLENPYHLQDFPRVKTYINCYSNNDHCLHQLIEKLTGRSTFKGHSPVDAFCGKWDAHL